ncbi:hypothetical protein [Glutamicibacter sp.]|uniref:hypothetical protein n=1 Tax=Glutamicibacter sp. TaxID=1931995 RepID=UPI003D6A056A
MPRIISAPMDLVIATHRGIDFRFAGLSLTTKLPPSRYATAGGTGLGFDLRGVINDETRRLDSLFHDALESWAEIAQEQGAEQAGPAPQMPSNAVLEPIKANITDDVGTTYACVGGRVGGTGTEWDATWIYHPAPPRQARQLVLAFTIDGTLTGQSCVIDLQAPDTGR